MEHEPRLRSLSDDVLLRRLLDLVGQSRRVEADLVAHVGEVDARRLYAREAAPSMFAYCTERLHLSEAEAYLRITVARAARQHPMLLEMLRDGRLHLSAIAKLVPHLTRENRQAVLAQAAHRSKREIEELIAALAPKPDVTATVRALPRPRVEGLPATVPARSPAPELRPDGVAGCAAAPMPMAAAPAVPTLPPASATVRVLAPARYKVQFTASTELVGKLDRLKALMRSLVPDGDLAALIEDAVTEKLARLEARRFAKTEKPRKQPLKAKAPGRSRHIPAPVRRAVYERDGGRCRYVDEQGRRCTARDHLEFHHRHPFGHGGGHDPDNLSLLCRTHNAWLAEVDYPAAKASSRLSHASNLGQRARSAGRPAPSSAREPWTVLR